MKKESQKYYEDHAYYNDIVTLNTQYTMASPYVDTTVVKTPESVIKGIYHSRYNRFTSEDYLLNFRADNRYFGFAMGVSRFSNRDALLSFASKKTAEEALPSIKLPKPKRIKAAFSAVMESRRSLRNFGGGMSLQELSTVLLHSCGVTGKMMLNEPEQDAEAIYLRSQASGGGFYPVTLYIVAWNVDGLERGIYEYYPYHHSIRCVREGFELEELRNLAGFGDIKIENSAFCFIYVYNLYINSHKYGDAGAAYAFIGAGEVAFGAQLSATALGCGGCDIGGYEKRYIEKMLKIDGLSEQVIHFTIFGKGE